MRATACCEQRRRTPHRRKTRAGPAGGTPKLKSSRQPRRRVIAGARRAREWIVGDRSRGPRSTRCAHRLQFSAKIETQSSVRHAGHYAVRAQHAARRLQPHQFVERRRHAARARRIGAERETRPAPSPPPPPTRNSSRRKCSAHRTRWNKHRKASACPPARWRTDPCWSCRSGWRPASISACTTVALRPGA